MQLSLALSGEEEAARTRAGHSFGLFPHAIARKNYLNSINAITLRGLQLNISIQHLRNYQKNFFTFPFPRDRVLHTQHAKFCIFVAQLPDKSKAMGLVTFLEQFLIYWMIPMCCSPDVVIVWLSLKHTLDFRSHAQSMLSSKALEQVEVCFASTSL